MPSLVFQKADEAKKQITDEAKIKISKLYSEWANDIGKRADFYKNKTTASSHLQELNMRQLKAQLEETSKTISNEVKGIIQNSIYQVSESVVQANNDWLEKLGFPSGGAFVSVPDETVRRLVTGQIYEGGWNLSKSIWGDNQDTLSKLYEIVAMGQAQNMSTYDVSKMLESYVNPNRALSWNLKMPDGRRIYKKQVDYNAQRLARTLTQHGYQTSFVAVTEKNPFVIDYIWIANGSRVCPLCESRDGMHFKKDELPLDHPNGMCTMQPNVDDEDLENKLAAWLSNPDGTFPEIDAFASEFGYEAFPVNTMEDFVSKYGLSTLGPTAYFKNMNVYQQMEFQKLKDLYGSTNNKKFYIQYVYNGDGKNLGKLTKFYNELHGITPEQSSDVDKPKEVLEAEAKVKQAEENLANLSNDIYTGIWKNDVTLSDYKSLLDSGSIQKKKEYYIYQIKNDTGKKYMDASMYLGKLAKFEEEGKKYAEALKALEEAKKNLQIATNGGPIVQNVPQGSFSPDLYSEKEKMLAHMFTSSSEADKFHRPVLIDVWDKLDRHEQYSVWEYTQNSNPINKSLSGYHDSWSRSDFRGLGNTDLGHEDRWRKFRTKAFEKEFGVDGHKDYKTVVKDLTNAIDKSVMPEGVYLVRGSDYNGLAGLLEGNLLSFDDAKNLLDRGDVNQIKSALEGQVFQNHSFLSTGIAKGSGFSGDVSYEIYAPKGTRGIYAEPTSYFGNTVGMQEKLYKSGQPYSSIGGEAEVILQRGTSFRITDVEERRPGSYVVKMEVVDQPDYFKTGLEHTHDNGATSYQR